MVSTRREAAQSEPKTGDASASAPERATRSGDLGFPSSGWFAGQQGTARNAVALQRLAGNRATAGVLRRGGARLKAAARKLARLGYPLGTALPASAPKPLKDEPDHREWKKSDFYIFWEQEQGRNLTDTEKKTIDHGCIGITANNLGGGVNPSLLEVYDDFTVAHDAMVKHNNSWWNRNVSSSKYVMFGMLFWSNQDPDDTKRETANPTAFKADPVTHKIDMTGYKYREKPGGTNFDYGFWDDTTNSFWHANHKEYGAADPMIVYQSTRGKFAKRYDLPDGSIRYGYAEFDRVAYGVAVANNYDPTKARVPSPAPAPPVSPPAPPVPSAS